MLISDLIRVFVANPFLADDADIYADNADECADKRRLENYFCDDLRVFLRNLRETKLE
jgi:hypothetical protein